MKKLKIKNIKKRQLFKFYELPIFIKKLTLKNQILNNDKLVGLNLKLFKYNVSKNSRSKITNRCIFSNKKTNVHKFFTVSRSIFRKLARFNLVYGLHKIYW